MVGGVVAALTRLLVAEVAVRVDAVVGEAVGNELAPPVADGDDAESVPGEALPTWLDVAGSATADTELQPVIVARRGMPRQVRTRAEREPLRDAIAMSPKSIPAQRYSSQHREIPRGGRGLSRRIEGGHGA